MKKLGKNRKVTTDDLAVMVAKGFSRMDQRLDDIDYRLGKIESNHERRLDLLEDKMQVVKTYFERNPQLKVKF